MVLLAIVLNSLSILALKAKGKPQMTITTTVSVQTVPTPFVLPGAKTVQQVIDIFGSEIPELGSMESSIDTGEDGNVTISFKQRTGTKG